MADVDEFLYHPDFFGCLHRCNKRGVTCIPALGYEMVADRLPAPGDALAVTIRRGIPHRMMSKLRLFDPNAVEETNFGPGGHVAAPTGKIVYPRRDELRLLHYKWLGFEYLRRRNAMMETTRRAVDRANNWGHHYRTSDEELASRLEAMRAVSVDVLALGEAAWREHKEGRWWRGPKGAAGHPPKEPAGQAKE